jgi:DNA-binding response OmpR family regulator
MVAAEDFRAGPVVILRWPEESASLERLKADHVPRLLLIAPGTAPPVGGDCEEDWIRLPADDGDVRARLEALARRAARHSPAPPELDEQGQLTFNGCSITLSRVNAGIAGVLVERYGQTVEREALMRTWPGHSATGNALRIQILRLRRRLAPLGLEVRVVPGHGYRLERAS